MNKKYFYFISYSVNDGGEYSFSNTSAIREKEIDNINDIREIERDLQEISPEEYKVRILYYQLLRRE